MTGAPTSTVLCVAADADARAAARRRLERASFRTLPARDGVDGLKRIDDGGVDCVVCVRPLADLEARRFIGLARDERPNLPFVVASEAADGKTATDEVYPDGDAVETARLETLAETVRDVLETRRVETALERHRDLKALVGSVRRAVSDATTSEAVRRAVSDRLAETDLFQFTRIDAGAAGSERGAADAAVTVSESEPGGLRTATVPLGDDARGALELSTTRRHAFDEAECAALADLGGVVGDALTRVSESDTTTEPEKSETNNSVSPKRFARTVAHEIRNPLDVAEGYLELAADEEDVAHLDRVRASMRRIDHVLERELAYVDEVDATDAERQQVADAAADAWELVPTKDAELVVDDPGTVLADRDLLVGLFANLFDNAVMHAGADATVRVGETDGGFYVADDGPGVDPADRDAIFEFGYTTESGTGVGLAVVRRIAEAHGWDVAAVDGDDGADEADGGRFEFTGVEAAIKQER